MAIDTYLVFNVVDTYNFWTDKLKDDSPSEYRSRQRIPFPACSIVSLGPMHYYVYVSYHHWYQRHPTVKLDVIATVHMQDGNYYNHNFN